MQAPARTSAKFIVIYAKRDDNFLLGSFEVYTKCYTLKCCFDQLSYQPMWEIKAYDSVIFASTAKASIELNIAEFETKCFFHLWLIVNSKYSGSQEFFFYFWKI